MIIVLYFIVTWILAIVHYSFLIFWPVIQHLLPLSILALFATVAHRSGISFVITIWCGLMLDWYSATFLGFNVMIFAVIWLIMVFTMKRFFTNLSLLSGVAMMVLSVILFRYLSWMLIIILNAMNVMPVRIIASTSWLTNSLWMILLNSLLFGILFLGANKISRIFNFAFINKR